MTKPTKDEIRTSTDADFKAIADWLRDEERQGVPGCFFCNLEQIEASHRKGGLLVYVDSATGSPVGFQLGGLIDPGILAVRYDMRGRGIGRRLVEYCISEARERNECLLRIECNPETSIPFWERMGFKLMEQDGGRQLAYRMIEKRHHLPSTGTPVKVAIRFYRGHQPGSSALRPIEVSRPKAVLTPDNIVHLERQVQLYPEIHPNINDAIVRIDVGGKTLCYEEAKYPLAKRLGVQRCVNGYFIDCIKLPVGP